MDLDKLRKEIDGIDSELVRLLAKRFEIAVRTRRLKNTTQDEQRETFVLENAKKNAKWLVTPDFNQTVMTLILEESRKIQEKKLTLIGFLGVHGCQAESAALLSNMQSVTTVPYESYEELFSSLENGVLDSIIIPYEGVIDVLVGKPLEMFISSSFTAVSDALIENDYCLLTSPHTHYQDVKLVYGHPDILALAQPLLERLSLKGIPYHDSAAAAQMIANTALAASAVLAPKACAESFSLSILKENCIEKEQPQARFLHLAKTSQDNASSKQFIGYFEVHNQSGSLSDVLAHFKDSGVNLSKLESLPTLQRSIARFIVEGSLTDSSKTNAKKLFEQLSSVTQKVKYLGTI